MSWEEVEVAINNCNLEIKINKVNILLNSDNRKRHVRYLLNLSYYSRKANIILRTDLNSHLFRATKNRSTRIIITANYSKLSYQVVNYSL